MQKHAPSVPRILVMLVFALSCFGLLLYLWIAFGGAVPLRPEGYRFEASFNEAVQLATESDVRISGVTVGKVKKISPADGRTLVEMQLDSRYAPIPTDARAILRQKSLLGETFVELTPGSPGAPKVPDHGRLASANVAPTVELDEVLRAFDPKTRVAFQDWLEFQGKAFLGRGADLNDAFGNLALFIDDAEDVVRVFDRQGEAINLLARDSGAVFEAFSERKGQLGELVDNANTVFRTTANNDQQLAETFRQFPGFLDEAKATTLRARRFTDETGPFIDQARGIAREFSPMLKQLADVSPYLGDFFRNLDSFLTAGDQAVPEIHKFFDAAEPLLGQLDPFLRNLNPVFEWLGMYKREITAFFANDSTVTGGTEAIGGLHVFRAKPIVGPEMLAAFPGRLKSNRSNPYPQPGSYDKLLSGLEVFDAADCAGMDLPPLDPAPSPYVSDELKALIEKYVYRAGTSPVAPGCSQQAPFTVGGETTQYPHLRRRSEP